jgi:hypothetical protein
MPRARLLNTPNFVLPLAALLATLPLLLHGVSCGQDLGFHLQSWIDAASQLRHGHYPDWTITPAWNAGEPRFLFYPPLSWLFGALLTLLLPMAATPIAYIFLTLTAAAFSMHRLARSFAGPHAALLATILYLANPYMLFNSFERSALAELLAAVWIPLLLLAILRPRPTVRGIAVPFALLWLTNAPAAVMGSYTFALLAAIRLAATLLCAKSRPSSEPPAAAQPLTPAALAGTAFAGTALGLALPAFYLIPAAFQRRFVQVAMAIIPNMRFQDNFLFTRTTDTPHNDVNATASYLTLTLLVTAILTLSALLLTRPRRQNAAPLLSAEANSVPLLPTKADSVPLFPARDHSVILSEGAGPHPATQPKDPETASLALAPQLFPTSAPAPQLFPTPKLTTLLILLTTVLTVLLVPISTPIWLHLPEFAYLQFPWRLNTILSVVTALALALLFDKIPLTLSQRGNRRITTILALAPSLALALPLALTFTCYHFYAQGCDITARPAVMDAFFQTHHGVAPTDEYTPNNADNDLLRTDDPAFWLAPANHPNAPAPNTVPTPTELNPTANTDDYVAPADQTISLPSPRHLTLNLGQAAILVLHLRDYPAWRITRNQTSLPTHLQRDDGLVALALPAGASTIDIAWHTGLDQTLGRLLSALALITLLLLFRPQHIKHHSSL